jgi:hypothetical protein
MIGEVDTIGLFYDKDRNVFLDEDGFIVWCIFELISPNDMFLFKKYKTYMLVPCLSIKGVSCELFYPEDDDMDELDYEN